MTGVTKIKNRTVREENHEINTENATQPKCTSLQVERAH